MFQIDEAQHAYLNQCILHRYLQHRHKTLAGEAEEKAYRDSAEALDVTAKRVYGKLLTIYSSFTKGWISHERWLQELVRLRSFLLDSNLINNKYLHFFELIQIVNTFIH